MAIGCVSYFSLSFHFHFSIAVRVCLRAAASACVIGRVCGFLIDYYVFVFVCERRFILEAIAHAFVDREWRGRATCSFSLSFFLWPSECVFQGE